MKLIWNHIIIGIFTFMFTTSFGQTVLIKQTTPEDFSKIDNEVGPNRKRFSYPFLAIGQHAEGYSHENDTTISPIYGKSIELRFGTRTRFKINKFLAFGMDYELGYSSQFINLKDEYALANFSPDVVKAKYQLYSLGGASYFQLNFEPRRGNQLGTYLDFGVFGGYNFGRRFTQTLKTGNKERVKYTLKRLQNFEKLKYGGIVRFGKNIWAIYAKYRFSNSFKDKATNGNYELPRLTFGFELFFGNV